MKWKRKCKQASEKSCSTDDDWPNEEGDADTCEFTNTYVEGFNIFDERFSWMDDREGGYCCGYGGVGDLGVVKTGATTGRKPSRGKFRLLK